MANWGIIYSLPNSENHACDAVNKLEYIDKLKNDLNNIYNSPSSKRKRNDITSKRIDAYFDKCIDNRTLQGAQFGYIRLKYVNHTLYATDYPWIDLKTGSTAIYVKYFSYMIEKYKSIIKMPVFDIVIWTHDYHLKVYKWENITSIPVFVGDRKQIIDNKINLYTIPRSVIQQYPHIGDDHDVHFLFYAQYNNTKSNELLFDDKINKAVFYGDSNNDIRHEIYNECHKEENKKYCDFEWARNRPVLDEMGYKFLIVIDGHSVRDAFFRQTHYDSIILKYKSDFHEYWYYNLKNGTHFYEFRDKQEFISLLKWLIDIVNKRDENNEDYIQYIVNVIQNMKHFGQQCMNEQSNFCFMSEMMHIYNMYFYDTNSIKINPELDKRINTIFP